MDPKKPVKKKKDTGIEGVKKSYPKYKVIALKKEGHYSLIDTNGHSVTLKRAVTKKPKKTYTVAEAINSSTKKK